MGTQVIVTCFTEDELHEENFRNGLAVWLGHWNVDLEDITFYDSDEEPDE